jgi:HK97 family phage prohead protease
MDDAEVAASFKVDTDKRTITGLLVPWGAEARNGFATWKFARGSLGWAAEKRVKLNLGHERKDTVGVAVRLQDSAAGLTGSFRIAQGADGDRALSLAAEDILDGFSIEVDFEDDGWTPDPEDDSVRLVTSAALKGVALTGYPAFDDARVTHIAAARDEGVMMDLEGKHEEKVLSEEEGAAVFEQKMGELASKITDSQVKLTQELGASIGDSVSQGVRSALETIGNPQDGPKSVAAARYQVGREESVYTFDGRGNSLVRDARQRLTVHGAEVRNRHGWLSDPRGGYEPLRRCVDVHAAGGDTAGHLWPHRADP